MNQTSQPIAKLTQPQTAAAVPRARLFHAIDELLERLPVLWVAAPGGAGKTVLISSYLRANGHSSLWFQIDSGDSDPSSFFHYLGQAVTASASRQRAPLPLFTAEYLADAPLFARRYFEALGQQLKPNTVIVFDNCEVLSDDAALWPLLAAGLRALPPGMAVFFTSRHEAPPAFSSLRINGHLAELGSEALKVTPDEAALIGAQQGETAEAARQLNEQSAGWIAGLILMLEQRRHGGSIGSPAAGSTKTLFDFFSYEIFARMPQPMRTLLLRTAYLPAISAAAAQHLSGIDDAPQLLTQLCRNNLFTERHGEPQAVYRYHPLFREFLIKEGPSHYDSSQVSDLKHASATVLAHAGDTDSAIRLFAEVAAYAEALTQLLATAPELLMHGRNQTFLALAALIPDEVTHNAPWYHYWHGIAVQPFNPTEAREHFNRAFALFKAAADREGMLRCWSALVESMFLAWDHFQQIDPWIARLDELINAPTSGTDPALELQVSSTMTAALTMRGAAPDKMRYWAERAIRALAGVQDIPRRLGALVYCTNYVAWVRPVDLDTALLEITLRDAEHAELPPLLRLTTLYTRAALTLHRAQDLGIRLEEVHAGLALAAETGVHVWDEILCGLGVYCATVLNDRAAAQLLVEKMYRCISADRKQGLAFYYYVSAWNALVFGSVADARELIAKGLRLYMETGYEFPSNVAYYGAAVIYAECGELDTALAYAQQADTVAERFQATAMRHTTLLVLAYVHHRRGEMALAIQALREALRLGRQGGYYLPLWWWHAPMITTLMELALHEGIESVHVTTVVRRLKLTPAVPADAPTTWPWPLTIRTLGHFDVVIDGQPLNPGKKPGQKPLALLKLLAAAPPDGIPTSRIADQLWPELDGDKAQHALEMAVHRSRKMVQNDDAIQIRSGKLRLNPYLCHVDAHSFASGVDSGMHALHQGRQEEAQRLLEQALMLYRGHFLAGDRYADLLVSTRERLQERYVTALEHLCALYEENMMCEQALELYRHACELDEQSETLVRGYMRSCLLLGRGEEARSAYLRLERNLKQSGGIVPTAATRELLDKID